MIVVLDQVQARVRTRMEKLETETTMEKISVKILGMLSEEVFENPSDAPSEFLCEC